jgi:S-adenosylmethionine:tRNA ribosyltransferase-isomerase
MIPAAAWPRDDPRATRLLHVDPQSGLFADCTIGDLRTLLRPGDLLVVNDAATAPASLAGVTASGEPIEARLTGAGGSGDGSWRAVLFGAGDWRRRTEDRPPPPSVQPGDLLLFGETAAPRSGHTASRDAGAPADDRAVDRSPTHEVQAGPPADGSAPAFASPFGKSASAPATAGTPGKSAGAPATAGTPRKSLLATVTEVDPASPRLVSLQFNLRGAALWRALYRVGRPVQYAHTAKPLALWQVQTAYAARPWAAEAPSAGFALTWDLLLDLRRHGIATARVTHAAGLSSTGDGPLDARLPLAESYEVPEPTVRAVESAHAGGGRVVAVGTTVARALEGAAAQGGGRLLPSRGTTALRLGPAVRRSVVDGIVTGLHDPGTSHFELLESFAPRALLAEAHAFAEQQGYRGHEFGDAVLILGEGRPER